MKAPPFKYHAPKTVNDAAMLLATLPNARVLAGGQSLMPMLNLRVAAPDHLIDLNRIEALRDIMVEGNTLITGAMCTQRSIERSELVAQHCPLLHDAITHVGHQQTRNRGTVGGSISHLDPGAELPVIAAALKAEIDIFSPAGSRRVAFSEFAQGYLTNCLEPDEIVTAIRWPVAPAATGAAFHEFNRRPADFAIVSAAVQMTLDEKAAIGACSIALGGLQATPVVLTDAALIGQHVLPADMGESLLQGVECDGDELYPPDFRQEIAAVLLQRALMQAMQRARSAAHV
jgi:carbon-monoxide dehydrogenase medium subunit